MYKTPFPTTQKIRKSQIGEAVLFAINNLAEVDQATLEKFLALVESEVTVEAVSKVRLIGLMNMTMRQNPNAHPDSLWALISLLGSATLSRYSTRRLTCHPESVSTWLVTQFQLA